MSISRQDVVDYVMRTPCNTNPNVLTSLLNQFDAELGVWGKITGDIDDQTDLATRFTAIEGKIPAEASTSNQLADKAYVSAQTTKGFTVTLESAFWQEELYFVYGDGTVGHIVTAGTYNNVVAVGHTVGITVSGGDAYAYYNTGADSKIQYNGSVVVNTSTNNNYIKVLLTNCTITKNS